MLAIEKLTLGPIDTNCFLVADNSVKDCVVVDPAWDAGVIMERITARDWNLTAVWLTHAHFDHFGALSGLTRRHQGLPLALHRLELPLYQAGGGADTWGIAMEDGPEPTLWLEDLQYLEMGSYKFEVLFVPGHTPGHVAFYNPANNILIGGDVLFQEGIGRTDLPGGDYATLLASIKDRFLTLPDDTRVYPGHGNDTTIGNERKINPFL